MELTSFFHVKDESEWTCVFHGSTLSKKEKSIMLTGDSGSGKSSLSTILMDNNFSLVADDFSPMSISGNHYNFPSAISIKEGFYKSATELYKINFESLKEYFISEIKGNVKYLPPENKNEMVLSTRCDKVFNVKFGENLSNEIKEINKGIALNKILPDSWISNNMEHAKSFINWVKQTSFYDLTYSDNEEIIKMINKII
jgi:GTPase SAR1 family protein